MPDEEVRATLLEEVDTLGTDTAVIGDGAPETFPASARSGLAVLSFLDSGTLTFDGKAWSLQGAVDTAQKGFTADAAFALAGLRDAGWTYAVQLPAAVTPAEMPMIDPYVWGAQKSLDGRVSFTGFAPSDAFKRFLAVKAGSDTVDSSVVGAGAPDNFIGNATAGLEALLELDEGALNVSGETWSLTGNASSAGTRATIQDRLSSKTDPSQWRVTVQAPEAAPVVTPYLWSAEKSSEGTVILSGYMPSDALRKYVAGRAGTVSRDSSEIASGEPSGFSDDVLAGLEALAHLTNGLARFDGTQWTLSGVADTAAAGKAARVALLGGSRGGVQWRQEIDAPEEEAPAVSEEPPAATNADSIVSLEPLSQPEPVVTAGPSEPATTPSEPSLPPSVTPAVEPVPEATVAIAPAAPVEPALAVPSTLVFEASRTRGQAMALSGAVPAEASRSYFGVIADKAPTDGVTIDSTLPSDFITSAIAAVSGIRQLAEGRAGFDGTRWWLTGKAADEATRDAVVASIEGLPNSIDWSTKVDLVPAIDLCRDTVSALASRNIITFQSGSAKLADSSGAALDELAVDLQICPDATVHVEGHTDADGPEEINLALSVSRAEAVVEALITRGVAIERLYAEGYGESVPIASNDTRDGKAANRRIAFTITEGD